jgi:hypothetical protein
MAREHKAAPPGRAAFSAAMGCWRRDAGAGCITFYNMLFLYIDIIF